jgi:hypothetical protein
MTETEFLKEYSKRFLKIVTEKTNIIKNSKDLHHNILFKKYIDINNSLSYLGNILISEIMDEYNLDYNHKVLDGLTLVPITSSLLRKSWTIQPEIRKMFDEETSIVLKESLCRDFPLCKDCQE